jgi:MFS family permease
VRSGIDSPRAWVIAFAVGVANVIGFGTAYSFGAFFESMAVEFDAGHGATAVIFGLTIFLFFGFGGVSGPLSDRFGPRPLVLGGATLMGVGLVLTSRVDALWVGYLTYGIGVGLGAGLYVAPLLATVGAWFERQRPYALGVAVTGSGLGTLLFAPSAARLIASYGWRTSYVVIGLVDAAVLLAVATVVQRAPVPRPPHGGEHLRRVCGTEAFRRLFLTGGLMSMSLFVAFAFVVTFAQQDGIASSRAALLLGLIGASSVAGRLGLTAFSNWIGPVRLYQLCLGVQSMAYLVWLVAGGNYVLLVVFACLLGISYGGFVALGPEVTAHLFGVAGLGAVLGTLYVVGGIGGLIGPPLAGFLVDADVARAVIILGAAVITAVSTYLTLALPTAPIERATRGSTT